MTGTNVLPLFISVSIMIPDICESVSYVINLGVCMVVFSIYSFVLLPRYLGNISCFTVNTFNSVRGLKWLVCLFTVSECTGHVPHHTRGHLFFSSAFFFICFVVMSKRGSSLIQETSSDLPIFVFNWPYCVWS